MGVSTPLPTMWRDFKNFPSPHSWLPPISTQTFSSPHPPITAIFEKSHPPPLPPLPLYEWGEVRTINSYAFLLVFKIVESLQWILKSNFTANNARICIMHVFCSTFIAFAFGMGRFRTPAASNMESFVKKVNSWKSLLLLERASPFIYIHLHRDIYI